MRTIRKLWNCITTLLVIVVAALAIALVGVRLVGLTPYAVLSGSMEPTYRVGALIYVKDVAPEDVEIGAPLTFVVNENSLVATHRVVGIEVVREREEPLLDENGAAVLDENGAPLTHPVPLEQPVYYFKTKGDANDTVDGSLVHQKNVVGTPVFTIPLLGYFSSWLQTRQGMIMSGGIALAVLILTFMPDMLGAAGGPSKRKKKKRRKKRPARRHRR